MLEVLVFAGVISLIVVSAVTHYRNEQKRTAAMDAAAKSIGFTFDKETVHVFDITLLPFKVFTTGHSRRCRNVMEQTGNDVSIAHFDYSYSIGSGKNRSTYSQTVTIFESKKLNLPPFVMAPESFFHRIGEVLGMKDIDFVEAPEFSKSYLLKGTDEVAIRSFFDNSLLRFFKDRPGLCIDTLGKSFVVYNKSKRIPVDEITAELKKRIEIYTMFVNRSEHIS